MRRQFDPRVANLHSRVENIFRRGWKVVQAHQRRRLLDDGYTPREIREAIARARFRRFLTPMQQARARR